MDRGSFLRDWRGGGSQTRLLLLMLLLLFDCCDGTAGRWKDRGWFRGRPTSSQDSIDPLFPFPPEIGRTAGHTEDRLCPGQVPEQGESLRSLRVVRLDPPDISERDTDLQSRGSAPPSRSTRGEGGGRIDDEKMGRSQDHVSRALLPGADGEIDRTFPVRSEELK